MTDPWLPEQVVSKELASRLIEEQFPQFKPAEVSVLGEGFDNTVFIVNDEYVFRFPRREIAVDLIQTENRLLPILAPRMPITIPNPLFIGRPTKDYSWPFAGYQKVHGKTRGMLSTHQRMKSVKPLALFLRALHNFPVAEAKNARVSFDQFDRLNVFKRKSKLEDNLSRVKDLGLLEEDIHQALQEFLEKVDNHSNVTLKRLVHGDLHIRNILVNKDGIISGIIDWGDVHIGHPAIDLSIVYSFLPPDGRAAFYTIYGEVNNKTKKLAKFKAIYTTILLLVYAVDRKDQTLIDECKAVLKLVLRD